MIRPLGRNLFAGALLDFEFTSGQKTVAEPC